jgi:nicotinate phosphoribosyltransferase
VKIFLSGGLDEDTVVELADIADGFGVGTAVSNASAIDLNAKIVEVKKRGEISTPLAKRGDLGGRKQVYRSSKGFEDIVMKADEPAPEEFESLLTDLIVDGDIVRSFRRVEEIREETLRKIKVLTVAETSLRWK